MRLFYYQRFNSIAALFSSIIFALAPVQTVSSQQKPRPSSSAQLPPATNHSSEARALLKEVAVNARTFEDLYQRAHVQSLAADALWPSDSERARAIFLSAWEAAKASDRADEEEDERQTASSSNSSRESTTEARNEVLSRAAARDTALGERFLRELLAANEDEDNAGQHNASSSSGASREPSPQSAMRLALGYELLGKGRSRAALEMVLPAAGEGVNISIITFLLSLHRQDNESSAALLRALIEATRNDSSADANTVLLLSAPILLPRILVTIDERGSLQYSAIPQARRQEADTSGQSVYSLADEPVKVTPEERAAFYNLAATILLRADSIGGSVIRPEEIARYFAITRLLPFFAREAEQFVPELQARANALADEIDAGRRDYLRGQSEVTAVAREHPGDPLRPQLDQLSRARTESERQRIYLSMVKTAVGIRAWDRARRAAEKIEDLNMRHAALSFIALNQVADISRAYADPREDDFDPVLKFVDSADLKPLARAWGYAQAAEIAVRKKKGKQRAVELLNEASRWAARADAGTQERVAAYAVVTSSAMNVDRQRAWDALHEAVKAANSAEEFSGEQVTIEIHADEAAGDESEPAFTFTSDAFRLDRIFAKMARLDFDKAMTETHALESGVTRSIAQIAVARAILENSRQ